MVLNAIDQLLAVFYSYPQRKRLGMDQHFSLMKNIKNIPGRMPCSQYHTYSFVLISRRGYHSFDLPGHNYQICHPGIEMNFSTSLQYTLTQVCHQRGQLVRSYVRMCIYENIVFGTM